MSPFRSPIWVGAATLLLGLVLTLAATLNRQQRNEADLNGQFDRLAEQVRSDLVNRLLTYQYGLRGARGVAITADQLQVQPQRFKLYSATRDLGQEFPGARGFGIITRVPQSREADFVTAARQRGRPDFAVRQLSAHDGERYVINIIEPQQANQAAIGLDIASEANRRTAAEVAMRSGETTLTGPITLVQATGKPLRSFLLLMPIYRPEMPLTNPAEREAAAVGWSYAPLVIDEVLHQLEQHQQYYALSLRDLEGADNEAFYTTAGQGAVAHAGPSRKLQIQLYGRRWEADLRATAAFVQAQDLPAPTHTAATGMLIAALCAALACVLARLSLRTSSERAEQARRAAIVDCSEDAIVGQDLDGRVTDWNQGAARLFGYSVQEALGRPLADLLLPEQRRSEDLAVRDTLMTSGRIAAHDTTRQHRDGSLMDVSVTATALMNANGECVGFTKTLRDIRTARAHTLALAALNANLESQVRERTASLDTALHDLRTIVDVIPSLIGYWDRNLVNRMANRAYLTWFGKDPVDMLGKTMADVLGETLYEQNRPYVEAALRGEAVSYERTIARLDGQGPRHAIGHYLPDLVDGEVRGIYALVYDVTELVEGRLKLAAAQRDNEALLGTIQRHSIVSVADGHGRITEANDAFCAISGYTRDELIGQDHRVLNAGVHPADFWACMWATVKGGQAWRGEVCNRNKQGELYWVDSIISPFLGPDGQVEKYISIRHDITVAKRTEAELRSSQAFLDRAGRIAGVGGWEVDLRQATLIWSTETYRIHEVPPDYLPTLESALNFYAPSAKPQIEAAVAACVEHGTPWDLELPFVTAKGRKIWVRAVGTAEFEDGAAVRLVGAFQDITERREAAASLARERQLMNSLLDTLPDQIYFKDLAGRFLRINPALARRYGLQDPAQAIGKSDADFFTAEHAQRTLAVEQAIIDSGQPIIDLEEQEFWPDRAPTWNLTTKMPLLDHTGAVIGTFGLSRDITARREMEEALRTVNQRFKVAADSAGLGVWEYNLQTGTLEWDQRMYELYGVTASMGHQPYTLWSNHLHPDDRERSERELTAAIAGGPPFNTTFRVVLPGQGGIRYLRAAAHVERDAQGQALRMTGVNFDVSERMRAEAELRETMTLLNAVLNSATQVSIIAVKPDGLISVFNAGAQKMLGYAPEEVIGKETALHFHDVAELRDRAGRLSQQWGRKVHTGQVLIEPAQLGKAEEWHYRRKDGSTVPVSLAVTAMQDDQDNMFGYLGIARDISLQQESERQLREAVHKANQANQAKSQFLANMSHEIRTPMNAVLGLTYLLERTALDPDQASTLNKISQAGKSLLAIINDVLDISKIEAGEMQLEQSPFALLSLLADLEQLLAGQAHAKGISFELDVGTDVPPMVAGDATRLGQVLTNLISNAIKFTHFGGVQLKVRNQGRHDDRLRVRFTVQDSGIGIAADALDKIFTPFAQADTSTTRRFGGTGLGLSIVKQLVRLMGGEMGVASQEGSGSEFWVEIDYEVIETPAAERSGSARTGKSAGLSGLRVLVADDNTINLEVARRILELEGAHVRVVNNGQEAVDLLAAEATAIDLVLMDVQMPVMDGLEATQQIRKQLALSTLPILALTAGITKDEHQRIRLAGMNDIIAKPFNPPDLVARIRRQVALDTDEADPSPAREAAPSVAGWPEIPGVDMQDAALRLGGDLGLFCSMMRRLLREFADLDEHVSQASALAALPARLHNLKGSAGTLGAKSIENLAARAELACLGGHTERAGAALRPLVEALKALRQHAGPVLQRAQERAAQPPMAASAPLDPAALAALVGMLNHSDLGALSAFAELSPSLRLIMPADAFGQLSEHIDNLQFAEAAQALATLG
jgi:PAS domain S-box-containing protein